MSKKPVRSVKSETVARRTRREWIEKIIRVIRDINPGGRDRDYFFGDNYLDAGHLSSALARLAAYNITALPIELDPEKEVSHQSLYTITSDLVDEAVKKMLQDRLDAIRDRAKHGNVEKQIKIFMGELGLFYRSPASMGTSMSELDELKRQGYHARVKRTIDKLKAVSHRPVSHNLFKAMGEVQDMVRLSRASMQELGLDSHVDLEEMLQKRARVYIKQTLGIESRNAWKSKRVLEICEEYSLTEESLGLEAGVLAREIAEAKQAEQEKERINNSLPPSRAHMKRLKHSIMEGLRSNRDPEPKGFLHSMQCLRSQIVEHGGDLDQFDTTEEELRELEKTEFLRDARRLAYEYKRGKCSPAYLFQELDALRISPEQVGVDPRERDLVRKTKN